MGQAGIGLASDVTIVAQLPPCSTASHPVVVVVGAGTWHSMPQPHRRSQWTRPRSMAPTSPPMCPCTTLFAPTNLCALVQRGNSTRLLSHECITPPGSERGEYRRCDGITHDSSLFGGVMLEIRSAKFKTQ